MQMKTLGTAVVALCLCASLAANAELERVSLDGTWDFDFSESVPRLGQLRRAGRNAYPGWHQNSSLRGMPRPLCQACGLFVV